MTVDFNSREVAALIIAANELAKTGDWCFDRHLDSAFEKLKEAKDRDDA